MKVVYVGCGMNAVEGVQNLDNSPSVIIGRHRFLYCILNSMKLLKPEQKTFINVVKDKNIKYGNVTKLPFEDGTMDLVYTSHTIEHLYREDLLKFIREAERVLKPDGVFRIVIPDLAICLEKYKESGDADTFCEALCMGQRDRPDFIQKLSILLFGDRGHKWMYDGVSMKKYIEKHSNFQAIILRAGETTLSGGCEINLREHEGESVYLECRKN